MRLEESRRGDIKLIAAVHHVVRSWVWLYTLGMSPEMRDGRRREISSDLWDQTHTWDGREHGSLGTASSILVRCLHGVPADLVWRAVEARTYTHVSQRRPTAQRFTVRSFLGLTTVTLLVMLFLAAITLTVVHSIEYENADRRILQPWLKYAIGASILAVGLVITSGGFMLIRREPWLGTMLTVSGIWIYAVLFYWMWYVPLLVATILSVFLIGRACVRANKMRIKRHPSGH